MDRPIHRTFMLDPDTDVDDAIAAYERAGWTSEGRGSIARINGVTYRVLPMKRFGDPRQAPKAG